ncbi:hypothetical protein GCM10010124_32850 [Pilimelia terevasa]|uniref:DUF3224 domain-containing protein n=1 Tax=Pilimelia terevasa TaxID=53372 RepID=A0A8J3FL41_9ACTN|nr:DUF3224 domain-containing protein [Pilimelia terevasa]GGK37475.1 hypothetical protein GCM10010124_32850 [Pilimelia terevasa]
MQTTGTFTVSDWTPQPYASGITTGVDVGHAHMRKTLDGAITGTAHTQFSYAYDNTTGVGTYVALETFTGSIDGRTGTLNLAHTATTTGADTRHAAQLVIVPASGTGDLTGITGTGDIRIDPDGTHHLDLDYTL